MRRRHLGLAAGVIGAVAVVGVAVWFGPSVIGRFVQTTRSEPADVWGPPPVDPVAWRTVTWQRLEPLDDAPGDTYVNAAAAGPAGILLVGQAEDDRDLEQDPPHVIAWHSIDGLSWRRSAVGAVPRIPSR